MSKLSGYITRLSSIRNQYGKQRVAEKKALMQALISEPVKGQKSIQDYYNTLLFILAYPDNKAVETLARRSLQRLEALIMENEPIKEKLFNTGISQTNLCAAFSFEMVKWFRKTHPQQIKLSSFEASSEQIKFILSAVMLKVESEILQDANAEWKEWLQQFEKNGEDLLDGMIAVFDASPVRPEVKDELWNAIGINVEINVGQHVCLAPTLVKNYYHRSITRKTGKQTTDLKAKPVVLSKGEAEQIIDCSRTILVRHLREINPISFTSASLVTYYMLPRGFSIALMGMEPERRHPIDSYMGYMVFKNGLPVAYAGSWIFFDSGRIGLNVFPAYRGGESRYIFQQVLLLHSQVYRLKRFSADPYQVGKQNSDGIRSGAFWVYYNAGFRPVLGAQGEIAAKEALKIKKRAAHRTPIPVLKKLAESRLELIMDKRAVSFDVTDLSLLWAAILVKKYHNNRTAASSRGAKELAAMLRIKDYQEENLNFVLVNWCDLLLADEKVLESNEGLKKLVKKLVLLKAQGSEEQYIRELQRAIPLRRYFEKLMMDFSIG